MSDADELNSLLALRRQIGADRAAIDASIFNRFGKAKAVMLTDLVGFSRAVEQFGILHFLQLIHESETLFLPLIQEHGGVCIKQEGDSLMVLFDSPQQALAASQRMIEVTHKVNPDRVPEEQIMVCIGLGFGTVLCIDDNNAWGAEVNAASRLGEDIAKGSEILVTEAFKNALGGDQFVECGVVFGTRPIFRVTATAAA